MRADRLQLTRRELMAASACLALNGCAAAAEAALSFNTWSIFDAYILALVTAPVAVVTGIAANRADHHFFPTAEAPSKPPAEEDASIATVVKAARKADIDVNSALKLVDYVGSQPVIDCMQENVALWLQQSRASFPVNGFDVVLVNETRRVVGGQFQFLVEDEQTGIPDGPPYWRNPFELEPGQRTTFRYNIGDDFKTTGLKRVRVVTMPDGIRAKIGRAKVFPVKYA